MHYKKIHIIVGLSILTLLGIGFLYHKYSKYLPTTSDEVQFPQSLNQDEIHNIRLHTPIQKIIVFKSQRVLYLTDQNEQTIRQYPIRLGFNPIGHKTQEGDGKTPEGQYEIDWRNSQSAFYKSLHVSYPNTIDNQYAQNLGVSAGGDIMIHGSASRKQLKIMPS